MLPIRRWLLLLPALALLAAPGCGRWGGKGDDDDSGDDDSGDDDSAAEAAGKQTPVKVETVRRGPISETIVSSATVDSDRLADVHLETTGTVEHIAVEEGARVPAGRVLATLRNPALKGEVDRAEAAFRRAEDEFKSVSGLFERGFVARNAYEEAAHAFDTARLTLEQARDADAARRLTSPIAGTVAMRDLRFGEAVTAGRLAFRVVDLSALKVEINLPERDLARVRPGQGARARSEVLEGLEVSGRVERISPVVDPATGTVKITIALDPKQEVLRPGMFVAVEVVTATREDALLVPKRALVYEGGDPRVFVVTEGKAVRKPVTVGFVEADVVEVTEGVAEGEQVVVVGQSVLRDGAEVRIHGS